MSDIQLSVAMVKAAHAGCLRPYPLGAMGMSEHYKNILLITMLFPGGMVSVCFNPQWWVDMGHEPAGEACKGGCKWTWKLLLNGSSGHGVCCFSPCS